MAVGRMPLLIDLLSTVVWQFGSRSALNSKFFLVALHK